MLTLKTFNSYAALLEEKPIESIAAAREYVESEDSDSMCVGYVVLNDEGAEIFSASWLYDEDTELGVWTPDVDFTIDGVL